METSRLFLRKLRNTDAPIIAEHLNDKDMAYNFGTKYPYSFQDASDYIDDALKNDKMKYAIILKETNAFIGVAALHITDNKASASIWLCKEQHGRGLGTEVLSLLAQYCFESLGLNQMNNVYFKNNLASKRIQEKVGSLLLSDEQIIELNGVSRIKQFAILKKENFKSAL